LSDLSLHDALPLELVAQDQKGRLQGIVF
jgi:hypothetical protein